MTLQEIKAQLEARLIFHFEQKREKRNSFELKPVGKQDTGSSQDWQWVCGVWQSVNRVREDGICRVPGVFLGSIR